MSFIDYQSNTYPDRQNRFPEKLNITVDKNQNLIGKSRGSICGNLE